jgi:hypothetical protein
MGTMNDQTVNISRIIAKAALEAGIEVKMDYSLRMFDWNKYLGELPSDFSQ